jgi:RNA polymerase sigma-70 factor (ECF subfamily)
MPAITDKEFAGIYDQYFERIRGFIRARIRDSWHADDLAQETFMRARRHIDSLRDPSRIKPWLFRIAYHTCQDHYRSKDGKPGVLIPLDGDIGIADPHRSETLVEQQEMSNCLQEKVLLLPDSHRTVLWLYDVLGFTHQEIADVLEINEGNVKVRLHRARKKMKSILKEHCQFERDERNVFVCLRKDGRKASDK